MRSKDIFFRTATSAGLAFSPTACLSKGESANIPVDLACPSDDRYTAQVSGPDGTEYNLVGLEIMLGREGAYILDGGPVAVLPSGEAYMKPNILEYPGLNVVFDGSAKDNGDTQLDIVVSCEQ